MSRFAQSMCVAFFVIGLASTWGVLYAFWLSFETFPIASRVWDMDLDEVYTLPDASLSVIQNGESMLGTSPLVVCVIWFRSEVFVLSVPAFGQWQRWRGPRGRQVILQRVYSGKSLGVHRAYYFQLGLFSSTLSCTCTGAGAVCALRFRPKPRPMPSSCPSVSKTLPWTAKPRTAIPSRGASLLPSRTLTLTSPTSSAPAPALTPRTIALTLRTPMIL